MHDRECSINNEDAVFLRLCKRNGWVRCNLCGRTTDLPAIVAPNSVTVVERCGKSASVQSGTKLDLWILPDIKSTGVDALIMRLSWRGLIICG
ncbi:hypothetical protein HYQ46_010488 [Verticillium longisporum]|nr:hypothetical protein HYQ44_010050 [Verticillium longisporum]KAG7126341.1 hypothetical protein HYQ46_010488 [Verticillium longisporum]